jgi:DNA-binding NarL/FixJ family response regulator
VGEADMKRCEHTFRTYIIARNYLAGEYLVQLLSKETSITPILCDHLPDISPEKSPGLFILDPLFAPIPVGECVWRLLSRYPEGKFIIVGKSQSIEEIVALLRQGLHGFIEYSQVAKSLPDAARTVMSGRLWFSTEVLQRHAQSTIRNGRNQLAKKVLTMTPRETQVLDLARQRLANKEIAVLLGVQESTVKFHLSNIFGKLHIDSRHDIESHQETHSVWDDLLSA